jgi:DNA-binding beta-propeller fold protein YncE
VRFPLLLALAVLLAGAAPASALTISQLPGTAGCVDELTRYGCTDSRGTADTQAVAVSPDGRHVYVAAGSGSTGALTAYARDASTGALRPLAGESGCVSSTSAPACARGTAVPFLVDVTVSPDGRTVYAISGGGSDQALGMTVFRRDPESGGIRELQCFSPEQLDGCVHAPLQGPSAVRVTPDGRTAVVGGEALTTFPLAEDGTVAGAGTCVLTLTDPGEELCSGAPRSTQLLNIERLEIAPDGTRVYAIGTGHLQAYDLDPASGAVKIAGCTGRSPGRPRCRRARATDGMQDLAVSPDGRGVYTAAAAFIATDDIGFEGITTNSAIGAYTASTLAQLSGRRGCALFASERRSDELGCARAPRSRGRGFLGASAVAVTPDGRHVVAGFDDTTAVALLRRNPATGSLTLVDGRGGCVRDRTDDALPGCPPARGLRVAEDIAISPDGRNAYVVSFSGVAVLRLR